MVKLAVPPGVAAAASGKVGFGTSLYSGQCGLPCDNSWNFGSRSSATAIAAVTAAAPCRDQG